MPISPEIREMRRRRNFFIKLGIFAALAALYIKVYALWDVRSFIALDTTLMREGPNQLIFVFIIAIIFIWLPSGMLEGFNKGGGYVGLSGGSGSNAVPSPVAALKFFGWVIYILPAILIAIHYLAI